MNLQEATIKALQESVYNNYEGFLVDIRNNTFNFYMDLIRKLKEFEDENYEKYNKLSETDPNAWSTYINMKHDICNDYDVTDYVLTSKQRGEDIAEKRLDRIIDEHITKLDKQITKAIGKVKSIEEISDNQYHLEGNNASCDITLQPIKLSGSKETVIKNKIKIDNIQTREVPLDYVPPKEDNEYIKQWKQNELDEYNRINKQFWEKYTELEKAQEDKREELRQAIKDYTTQYNQQPERDNTVRTRYYIHYKDPRIENINEEYIKADGTLRDYRTRNAFFYQYGKNSNCEEIFKKNIDKHFEQLQNKVESKIGEIVTITPTGNNGYDYYFEGTKGNCNVEVILAGGYNIQRLHTRWIIKNLQTK